jgi:transposase
MRKRKIPALEQRRANSLLLLDEGWTEINVAHALFLDATTILGWKNVFLKERSISSLKLNAYKQREGKLTADQEQAVIAHFSEHPPRDCAAARAWLKDTYQIDFSRSGAIALMNRLGFAYKKPNPVPRVADIPLQEAHIAQYQELTATMDANEAVVFVDAVHPEYQTRPAYGWFRKDCKTTLKTTSGRQRINVHGGLNLETGEFTYIEERTISAQTTKLLLERIETAHPGKKTIHVFLDNARYHHAKILQPWLKEVGRRVKLHFLPAYCPHLNPIERLWGEMHRYVTHNRFYETFTEFIDAVKRFLDTVESNWNWMRERISDSFRLIAPV